MQVEAVAPVYERLTDNELRELIECAKRYEQALQTFDLAASYEGSEPEASFTPPTVYDALEGIEKVKREFLEMMAKFTSTDKIVRSRNLNPYQKIERGLEYTEVWSEFKLLMDKVKSLILNHPESATELDGLNSLIRDLQSELYSLFYRCWQASQPESN